MNRITKPATLNGVQRLLEAALIVSSVSAVFLLLALYSYAPTDPGWSQTAFGADVKNMTGAAGALVADLLFFILGYQAYLVPFLVAFLGWYSFRRYYHVFEIDYTALSLRLLGGLLLLLGISALASINFDDFYFFSAGGMLGDVIAASMLPAFNLLGTTVVLMGLVLAGFTLATGLSWVTIADFIGATLVWIAIQGIYRPIQGYRQRRQSQREEQFESDEDNIDESPLRVEEAPNQSAVEPSLRLEELAPFEPEDISEEEYDYEDEFDPLAVEPPAPSYSSHSSAPAPAASPAVADAYQPPKQVVNGNQPAAIPAVAASAEVTDMPTIGLLDRADKQTNPVTQEEMDQVSRLVEAKLLDFGIQATVVGVFPGPVVTRFELDLAPGVKVSRISNLSKDLARALSAISVRVVEVIPGKSVIGLELPNAHREIVRLSEVIECPAFENNKSNLTMVLGKDIGGKPVAVDLAKMPHLLVAGTTGSGKSVGVNVMIVSLLYKSKPEDVRFIMIDPKMLELSVYEGIPHLLTEVVTDMKDAANALRWCVGEMERRYKLMSAMGVRNLKGFNTKISEAIEAGTPIKDPLWTAADSMDTTAPELETLPSIVVVVDEFADMMMIVGKKVEELIARLAQKARAAGIHLVLATQRPSVDVITGLIKANIPTRMAFQVSSKIDSRTILDQPGAEQLLGQGDMLYLPPGTGVPTRVHGAFVDDHEVHAVVEDWKRRGKPNYIPEILSGEITAETVLPGERPEGEEELDVLYDEAVAFVTESRRGSISSVQRKFKIGYNRAARLIEQMEMDGVVSSQGHNGNREVLAPPPPRDGY
ncbi:DNA translocase FtsK [Corallincola spongiicola]|uniref:DNA translocase FtsK n=1 Tax=Corallincola spongiicola TaxID=2520508 RepID=UPI001FEB0B84|nr:DNA translocase FtsK 4TM domain-containing protein [Corallincola spongiicola]